MFQLIYLSWASDTFDPFGPRGMQSILNTAQNFNSSKNITGMLIFRNQLFLQLLEGEQKDVMELFEKIKSDPRHKDIQV
ncbi:MAG: BLUF domain-containing protein, partial [Bdellovibrionales bacterium]|nr:BLUF domain-containing protein [Bdellovibrionales bacterium]